MPSTLTFLHDQLEPRDFATGHGHSLHKHCQRPDPEGMLTVEAAIDHQLNFGFTMARNTDDLVTVALVVSIAAGFDARLFHAFGAFTQTAYFRYRPSGKVTG